MNARGGVVRVDSAAILPGRGTRFAIASNAAKLAASQLIQHGRVRRSAIGVAGHMVALPRRVVHHFHLGHESGAPMTLVEAGGPAAREGFLEGDIIVAFDGVSVGGIDDLQARRTDRAVGVARDIRSLRGIELVTRTVVPREVPAR